MTFDNPFQAFVEAETKAPVKEKRAKAEAKPQRNTKKARAVEIYKKHIADGKAAVTDLYKSELQMSDAGANSYFYAIKKQLS